MLKRILIPFLLLAVLLAACQRTESQPGGEETAQPSAIALASPNSEQYAAETTPATQEAVSTQASQPNQTTPSGPPAPPGCTVVSPLPTPGPTEQSVFPPVSETDWVQGPQDAEVTITEYSDFQ